MSSFKKSDEWLERRLLSIGGSEIASVLGENPYKTAYQLWLEKTKRIKAPDISHLPHVMRGHISEETARARLERETLTAYRSRSWVHPFYSFFTASDDGYSVDNNWTIEIKAMGKEAHETVKKTQTVPKHYLYQIQWGLMISKCVKCIFISYRIEDDDMVCVDVLPDLEMQKQLEEEGKFFWLTNIQQDIPPALTDKDYIKIADKGLEDELTKYKELVTQRDNLEEAITQAKSRIKPYTSKHPAIITSSGVKISIATRQGNTDYAKLCKDKGFTDEELKAYKKKPIEVFTIRLPSSSPSSS